METEISSVISEQTYRSASFSNSKSYYSDISRISLLLSIDVFKLSGPSSCFVSQLITASRLHPLY